MIALSSEVHTQQTGGGAQACQSSDPPYEHARKERMPFTRHFVFACLTA